MVATDTPSHPVLAATETIAQALKSVADVNPTFMSPEQKARALTDLVVLETRTAALRLRIMADAGDVAGLSADRDVAGWLTHHTRVRLEDARADQALARALDHRYPVLARALGQGELNLAQARVITRALDALAAEVPEDTLALAETSLIDHAATFAPRPLAALGRRILDVIAPGIAEAAEARALAALEEHAQTHSRLCLRRLGDGTTRLSARIPDATAHRLLTYLEAFTNPRRHPEGPPQAVADGVADSFSVHQPHPRRLGQAFCRLLECYDPARLPLHAGDATTVMITLSLDQLRADLAAADLLGTHVPGPDETAHTGQTITAAQARRLACTAQLIPVVLGGDSEILDLGRARRLSEGRHRKALLLRDRTCRAEGCDIPGTWAEAHHLRAWSRGGRTNLDELMLLCSHHHHRAHDPDYLTIRLPNGDLRYTRRT